MLPLRPNDPPTGLRPEARYAPNTCRQAPGLTRQAHARTPGPGRAAARRPRRGNARRVARRVTTPPRVSRQPLRATGFGLVPHLEGYELPRFDTGWDANALPCGDRARPPRAARRDRRRPPRQQSTTTEPPTPRCFETHAATRRATRRSRRASRRPTQLRRDPTLRSRLTEPTARPTPLNRRASDALRAFAPAQAAHPPRACFKALQGVAPLFSRRKPGPPLNRGLDKGRGCQTRRLEPGYALRSSLLAQPLTPRKGGQFSSGARGSIFERP